MYLGSYFNSGFTYISDQNFCQNLGHTGQELPLLKTTIVATLWNNLSCKLKVMAQFLYILYITVNVVTCAKQKSM